MAIWMQSLDIHKLWQAQNFRKQHHFQSTLGSALTSLAPEKRDVHVWVEHASLLCKVLNFGVCELFIFDNTGGQPLQLSQLRFFLYLL